MANQLTEDDKKIIYNALAEGYIELVKKGVIGKVERKVVSKKVLDAVEKAVSYEEIYLFLNSIISLYPDFAFALAQVKGKINKTHEEQVMTHLQSFLKTAST